LVLCEKNNIFKYINEFSKEQYLTTLLDAMNKIKALHLLMLALINIYADYFAVHGIVISMVGSLLLTRR